MLEAIDSWTVSSLVTRYCERKSQTLEWYNLNSSKEKKCKTQASPGNDGQRLPGQNSFLVQKPKDVTNDSYIDRFEYRIARARTDKKNSILLAAYKHNVTHSTENQRMCDNILIKDAAGCSV